MRKIINVVYKVDDKELGKAKTSIQGVEKETKDAEKEMQKLDKTIQKTGTDGQKVFQVFGNVMKAISFSVLGVSVAALGKKIFDLGVKQEQLNIAFTTFLGSAEKGKKLLQELTKFSIITPFSPDQVNSAAKALLAFGVKGDEVIPTLKMLGDVSSGTGKDLTEMAVIFGQIRSTGRLMGQDLLQLINAGFNPLQVISEKTGKSMAVLKKEMEDGKISFDMVSDAFKTATSEGGLFFDLMKKQSESIGGLMSTIEGNIEEGLKNLFSQQSGPIKDFVQALGNVSAAFLEWSKSREQLMDEKEAKSIKDVTDAYDLLNKRYKDSARAKEEVIRLTEERIAQLTEEWEKERDASDARIDPKAKEKTKLLADQIDSYKDYKSALEDYIYTQSIATKKTTDDSEEQKKSAKQLNDRAKALKEINKQLGFKTGAERFVEKQAAEEREAKRQSEAIDREIEQDQRRAALLKANNADMEAEKTRIAEEEADKRLRIANEEAANREAAMRRSAELAIELGAQVLEMLLTQREIDTSAIRDDYDKKLKLAGDNEKAREQLEAQRDKKLAEAERKNKEIQKKNAIVRIGIETAVAVIKTMAQFGYPAGLVPAGLMIALGAFQAANVRKYKKGEVDIDGAGNSTSDSIPAMISKGESVINAESTKRSKNLLTAINERKIDDGILKVIANNGGSQAANFDDTRIVQAIHQSRSEYEQHGYTLMKAAKTGSNFKLLMRAKIQGY